MNVSERIISLRLAQSLTQRVLAQRCGISQGALSNLENGKKQPTIGMLQRLCDGLGVTLAVFFQPGDGTTDAGLLAKRISALPEAQRKHLENAVMLFESANGQVPVSKPEAVRSLASPARAVKRTHRDHPRIIGYVAAGLPIEAVEEGIPVQPLEEAPREAQFGLLVKGNSMEPRIADGAIVWLDPTTMVAPGQIGVFLLESGEATCKKLEHKGDTVQLISFNPAYAPILIPAHEELRQVGKVVGISSVCE